MNIPFTFWELSSEEIKILKIKPGNFIVDRDSDEIYLDTSFNSRICLNKGTLFIPTEEYRESMTDIAEFKMYYVLDSHRLYVYDGQEWFKIGSNDLIIISNIVLLKENWIEENDKFYYTIEDDRVTAFDKPDIVYDLSIQDIIDNLDINNSICEDGKIIIIYNTKPNYDLFCNIYI